MPFVMEPRSPLPGRPDRFPRALAAHEVRVLGSRSLPFLKLFWHLGLFKMNTCSNGHPAPLLAAQLSAALWPPQITRLQEKCERCAGKGFPRVPRATGCSRAGLRAQE